MKIISTSDYQKRLELTVPSEYPADRTTEKIGVGQLVSLVRRVILYDPQVTRRELNKHISDALRPINIDENVKDQIGDCLDLLLSMNEIVELYQESRKVFVATSPCWIKLDDCHAVVLGDVVDSRLSTSIIDDVDIVRRFVPDEDNKKILHENGVREISASEWCLQACSGKICEGVAIRRFSEIQTSLIHLWNEKKNALSAQPAGSLDPLIRLIDGRAEGFWGNYKTLSGRWRELSEEIPDGIYFAVRPIEYGTDAWMILKKEATAIRVLSLRDKEQWLCLFWAERTEARRPNRYDFKGDQIQITIPTPHFLENLLRLYASKQPEWGTWKVVPGGSIIAVLHSFEMQSY